MAAPEEQLTQIVAGVADAQIEIIRAIGMALEQQPNFLSTVGHFLSDKPKDPYLSGLVSQSVRQIVKNPKITEPVLNGLRESLIQD